MGSTSRYSGDDESPTLVERIAALPRQIVFTLCSLFLVSLVSGMAGLLAVHRVTVLVNAMIHENIPSVRAGNELKNARLEQRGLVASYVLDDGNAAWLD
jgi:hypothetical protein